MQAVEHTGVFDASGGAAGPARARAAWALGWLIGLLLATTAMAEESARVYLLLNGKAVHLKAAPDGAELNERNWGLGVQYEFAPSPGGWIPFLTMAGFDDSNRNASYYVGGGWLRRFAVPLGRRDLVHGDLGIVLFLMTREGFRDGEPFFALLPAFSLGGERVAVNFTYVPDVHPKMVPLVFFQLKIGLAALR